MYDTTDELYEYYDLDNINQQLNYCRSLGFYETRLDAPVRSWADFRDLPLMDHQDLVADVESNPPYGTLYHDETALTCLTPTGQNELMMEFMSRDDLDEIATTTGEMFANAGIEPGDTVISCFSYTPFAAGYLFHIGLDALNVNVVPLGPGNAQQTANIIDTYDVDALVSAPSFALDIAANGGSNVDTIVCAGEPFSAIPGYKDEVEAAFDGATVVDYYGVSEIGPVGCERADVDGMAVATDYILVELLDSNTHQPVGPGERGELVVTHLTRESQPLVRYRTGDLTTVSIESETLTLPDGVFGRVDDMLKVKGVKLYPSQLALVLHGFDGLTGNAIMTLDRPENTDRVRLDVEGDTNIVDTAALSELIQTELLISPNQIELHESLDADGIVLDDERY